MKKVIPFLFAAIAGVSLSSFDSGNQTTEVYYLKNGIWKHTNLTPCPFVNQEDCMLPIAEEGGEEFTIYQSEGGPVYRRASQ